MASSAVSLWAPEDAFGAAFFYRPREAIPFFVVFLSLTVGSGFAEPLLAEHPAAIPAPVRDAFFVLNIAGASVTAYLLLQYAVRARDTAMASSERLLLNVLPKATGPLWIPIRIRRLMSSVVRSRASSACITRVISTAAVAWSGRGSGRPATTM